VGRLGLGPRLVGDRDDVVLGQGRLTLSAGRQARCSVYPYPSLRQIVVVAIITASQVQPVDCAELTPPKLVADNENFVSFRKTDEDVSGYLASYYAQTLGHGRPDCPWTIAVRPGQRIQLTLIDFSADARYGVDGGHHESGPPASAASAVDPAVPDFCYRYAQVSEGLSTSRRYTVCAEETREQVVYTSSSNVLNVEITDTVLADVAINFLIKYTGNRCFNRRRFCC